MWKGIIHYQKTMKCMRLKCIAAHGPRFRTIYYSSRYSRSSVSNLNDSIASCAPEVCIRSFCWDLLSINFLLMFVHSKTLKEKTNLNCSCKSEEVQSGTSRCVTWSWHIFGHTSLEISRCMWFESFPRKLIGMGRRRCHCIGASRKMNRFEHLHNWVVLGGEVDTINKGTFRVESFHMRDIQRSIIIITTTKERRDSSRAKLW